MMRVRSNHNEAKEPRRFACGYRCDACRQLSLHEVDMFAQQTGSRAGVGSEAESA